MGALHDFDSHRLGSPRVGSASGFPEARVIKPGSAAPDAADQDILQRCLDGSEEAFAELVDKYQQRAFWIAYHVVGQVEPARDVVQEAFVRVHRSLGRFDFARNFYTWFYRIVTNLAIDHLRKIQTARATQLEDFAHVLPAADETSAVAETRETRELVWRTLDKLDGKFRSVLVLRDIHELSCREIAPILKVTHATVRWRLHRGRQIFREHWERMTKDGEDA
jgi:RNA polymerase sigma-70 factor (ECF subfamily)